MRVDLNNKIHLPPNNITFEGARSRKLIEKVRSAEKIGKLKITFEELEGMYNEIGYDVFYKGGSHAVVPITEDVNLPIVIPHKKNNVHVHDLKRFRYILAGEIDKALKCR